jgi:membrane-associated PAP2 superfamily phosphatase
LSDRNDHTASRLWAFGRSPALLSDPIVQAIVFIALVSLLFLTFPAIDPWFSGLFYEPGAGFPMSHLGAFTGLRALGDWLVKATVVVLIAALVLKLARPARPSPVAPNDILFLLSTLAIGPGLVVNLLFKENWGRPRPSTIELFGGDAPFVPIWRMSDHCLSNCSFVSGEASAAVWLVAVSIVFPPRWRSHAFRVLLVLAVLLSLNRIAFGRHFLSDTLIAWGLTLLIMAVMHRLIVESPPAWLDNQRLEAGLTRLGSRLRDSFTNRSSDA